MIDKYLRNDKSSRNTFRRIKRWQIACFMLLLGAVLHFGTVNVSAAYVRYATTSGLNIRKKPNSKAKIVGTYKKGTKINCYGTSGNWTKVKYNGKYRYVYSKYLSKTKPAMTYTRYVSAKVLNIRAKASTKSEVVGQYKKGTKVKCYSNKKGWTKIKYNGKYCYVSTQYLTKKKPAAEKTPSSKDDTTPEVGNEPETPSDPGTTPPPAPGENGNSITTDPLVEKGKEVASYALKFVGNPYKWGGSSLTEGADCSGFTMAVYAHFGYDLPHSSIEQRKCGKSVSWSKMREGDLICYEEKDGVGHVGIYVGKNEVVHASSEKTGIKISKADYRAVNCVRRIVK